MGTDLEPRVVRLMRRGYVGCIVEDLDYLDEVLRTTLLHAGHAGLTWCLLPLTT